MAKDLREIYEAATEPDGAAAKWTMRHREWAVIYSQLIIYFGERLAERA